MYITTAAAAVDPRSASTPQTTTDERFRLWLGLGLGWGFS